LNEAFLINGNVFHIASWFHLWWSWSKLVPKVLWDIVPDCHQKRNRNCYMVVCVDGYHVLSDFVSDYIFLLYPC